MKRIPLPKDKFTLVDDDDFDRFGQYRWMTNGKYAMRKECSKTIYLHRIIMSTPQGMCTDHIDGNRLNNQKSNLRVCTKAQNGYNRGADRDGLTGYKGLYFDKFNKKYRARIVVGGKMIQLGRYTDPKEAARVWNEASRKYHGEYAYQNIIE